MPVQSIVPRNPLQSTSAQDALAPLTTAAPGRPFVIAQLGQSLDGRIATPTGDSRWINRDCALDHVHRLRAHVDAVVVGVGTVIADDPWLTVRRVPGRQPARVVIDPNGRMSPSARILAADGIRRFVVCGDDHHCLSEAEPLVVGREGRLLAPNLIVAALFNRGFKKILIEGGWEGEEGLQQIIQQFNHRSQIIGARYPIERAGQGFQPRG